MAWMNQFLLLFNLIQTLLKLNLQQLSLPGLHGSPEDLGAGDPLQAAHLAELQFSIHELSHALVQLGPGYEKM